MNELRELARQLLTDGTVQVVIGWEEGPRRVRPVFVTAAADADRLVFDHRCVHNLTTYLNPRRTAVKALGRPAVVVKACDAKAVAGLIRESQIARDEVVVIGVRCGGVVRTPERAATLSADTVAPRCLACSSREPQLVDHLVGEAAPPPPAAPSPDARADRLQQLLAASAAERWAFWQAELARCVRCHACREACPLCFCARCVADKTQPQWIESSPHGRGNLAWHLTRALHQAGRCVACGECERACPADIPLGLLNRHAAAVVERRFAFRVSDDPAVPAPIGSYALDDAQEFIL